MIKISKDQISSLFNREIQREIFSSVIAPFGVYFPSWKYIIHYMVRLYAYFSFIITCRISVVKIETWNYHNFPSIFILLYPRPRNRFSFLLSKPYKSRKRCIFVNYKRTAVQSCGRTLYNDRAIRRKAGSPKSHYGFH